MKINSKTEKQKNENRVPKNWKPQSWVWYQILIFMLAIILYIACCYPIYTGLKTRSMQQLFKTLQQMDLQNLDDDDMETLYEFQKEKFEVMVANENFEQVYTSRSALQENYIHRHIKSKLDKYTENATVEQRSLELRHVLILRGKIQQDSHTFYVYIKKDVQAGIDIIKGTATYFVIVMMLIVGGYYFFAKKGGAAMEKQNRQSDYQLLESQREFVANISHELKTPLAVVSSQVEMLEIAGDKIDRSYYYGSIREELDKMSKMVGELLDFSMLDNQMSAMEMSKVNVSELVEYLLLRYDAIFQKNEIKIEKTVEKNCYVYGNRMYLERAVNNYLMNAFQHTEQGKWIRVRLKKEKQKVRLEVYNDGQNIQEDQMERIWDSFYTSSRKKQGAPGGMPNGQKNIGIGLFIVRKIVEKHEGRCGAENMEDGVLFWMELPVMPK